MTVADKGRHRPVKSPSTRREWIEIAQSIHQNGTKRSPSTRREWIEIGIAPETVDI